MSLPECCTPSEKASLAERLYAAYNRAGDPATAGLNYQGKPCPTWLELPENIRAKWEAASSEASQRIAAGIYRNMDPGYKIVR